MREELLVLWAEWGPALILSQKVTVVSRKLQIDA